MRLLSNNPDKQNRLADAGVTVVEMVPTEVPSREQNIRYLQTKKTGWTTGSSWTPGAVNR